MIGGFLGMDLAEGFAMIMFLVFMAMILTGYNVAFSFAATGVMFAFLGHVFDVFDPNALNLLCLLYTSPSPRDGLLSRMPSSA